MSDATTVEDVCEAFKTCIGNAEDTWFDFGLSTDFGEEVKHDDGRITIEVDNYEQMMISNGSAEDSDDEIDESKARRFRITIEEIKD